ncbi:uncharacterized protein EDB91DRAFT_1125396 [Suillus paluster]|uniref:uncharacterized protein n=1 Tax=Suillus paluster TaxID=48578 RepID=UPI001B86DB5B|nr:uncharacterized protein EDB91DRAFT_1125396 [Suillus paluster]KAG1743688.1 hypothetical protein EDB91DRAFT_1125396 [Suillus paluster]
MSLCFVLFAVLVETNIGFRPSSGCDGMAQGKLDMCVVFIEPWPAMCAHVLILLVPSLTIQFNTNVYDARSGVYTMQKPSLVHT